MLDALWWMWTSDRKIYTLCRSCHVQLHASSLDFHLSALYFLIIKSRELHSLISGHFYIKWMISCMIHSLPVGRIFSAHYLRNIFFYFVWKKRTDKKKDFSSIVHSPNARAWPKVRGQNSIQVFHLCGWNPSFWATTCPVSGCASARSWARSRGAKLALYMSMAHGAAKQF